MQLKECIERFYEKEKTAYRVYEKILEYGTGEISRVAETFKNQEMVHAQKIRSLSLKGIERAEVPDYLTHLLEEKAVEKENLNFPTLKSFFLFALQLEKDSIIEYSEFKNVFEDLSSEYRLFDDLIQDEKDHMYFILKQLHEMK